MNEAASNARSVRRSVKAYRGDEVTSHDDALAVEEPLEIRIGDEPLAVTMRTRGHDQDLAAGFCLTEGIIREPDELVSVSECREAEFGNIINVDLTDEAHARRGEQVQRARREMYLSSSCGLCGKQTIDRICQTITPLRGRFTLSRNVLAGMPETMRSAQATFDETGGLHAAALFTIDGRLKVLREDIGRHNAVDKVIGTMLLTGDLPADPSRRALGAADDGDGDALPRPGAAGVLLVSGRAGFEIVQKAAMAGVCVIASVSAPSSIAVDLAVDLGITLVGFLRPGRMNVYNDAGRLAE